MIRTFEGTTPNIADSAFISEAAYIVGDVTIGERSSVWPGASLRADFGPITIGANTHLEDNVTVHCGDDGIEIGNDTTIGHNAVIHCRRIGDRTLIANSATLLDGAEIGNDCVVAAGAVLRPNTTVPDNSLVIGVPATVRPLPDDLKHHTSYWIQAYAALGDRYKAAGLDSRQQHPPSIGS